MFSIGRVIGVGFGIFAIVCLIVTYDYSRGRTPQTASQLVADVLATAGGRECGRDATEIVQKQFPIGMEQQAAEAQLESLTITPPRPWFWTPRIEHATSWTGDTLEALRTIKTTAFGNNLLRMHLTFQDARLTRIAAEVVCRFD